MYPYSLHEALFTWEKSRHVMDLYNEIANPLHKSKHKGKFTKKYADKRQKKGSRK